jgi:hypothetical protein
MRWQLLRKHKPEHLCRIVAKRAGGRPAGRPHGAGAAHAPAYFSLDAAPVEAIQKLNPSVANQTFNTVRQPDNYKVPYLLVNATIDGPTSPGG